MKSLSLFCYSKYSDLLKALDSIKDPSRVIETGSTHRGQYVLICEGEADDTLRAYATDFSTITNVSSQLLPAYFKQKPVRVQSNFVCIESEKLSSLFEAANTVLSKSNFECIEINRGLTESGLCFALFANGDDESIFKMLGWVQVTTIATPGATIKKFF